MSSNGEGTADHDRVAEGRARGLNIGWTVFSYLIGGMLAYGGIGALIGRAVHVGLLFPIGMLVGLAISIGYIIYRYGARGHGGQEGHGDQKGTRRAAPTRERGAPGGRTAGLTPKEITGDR
jgi:ATP synthase protein I